MSELVAEELFYQGHNGDWVQSYLARPLGTGKAGVMGVCSGGRQSYLIACSLKVDAAVDCWGGGVTPRPDRPDAPLRLTNNIACQVLGLFGNDDQSPSPKDVDDTEAELKR